MRIAAIQAATNANFVILTYGTRPGLAQLSASNYVLQTASGLQVRLRGAAPGARSTQVLLQLNGTLPSAPPYTLQTATPGASWELSSQTPTAPGLDVTCPTDVTVNCAPPGGATVRLSALACQSDGYSLTANWQTRVLPNGPFGTALISTIYPPNADPVNIHVGDPQCANAYLSQTFPPGSHQVRLTVTDADGNVWRCTNTVTVTLSATVGITCPANITNTICGTSAAVSFANPVVTDGALESCVPASGTCNAPCSTAGFSKLLTRRAGRWNPPA